MKRKPFLLLLCLALLLPLLFMSVCAVGIPAKYDATYMGELKYKVRRLSSVGRPKIVLVGGSSAAFGADSSLIEKEFPDYEVVNFGMYASTTTERFAEQKNHINGIENFWSLAKRVLRKYNGIERKSFTLCLKECEFRFNYGSPSQQLKTLRSWCQIGW